MDSVYYDRAYEECHGEYRPFRDHDTGFGWGIRHAATGAIFGYVGEKSKCFGVCAALNGNWEAAREFLKDKLPSEYFARFKEYEPEGRDR